MRLKHPKPINNDHELEEVRAMVEVLAVRGENIPKDQLDYLDALGTFMDEYEREHHAIDTSDVTPLEMLEHLMENHGLNASDLGRLLGERSLGSKVLRGERELSKAHIRLLAEHFHVSPAVFL